MLLAALIFAAPADAPVERVFGDWAVACDNVRRCTAVALGPLDMTLIREPGPRGGLTIAIAPKGIEGRVMLSIDGKAVAPGILEQGAVRLSGSAAEGLARAMAAGRILEVRDYRGKRVGQASLAGSSAALRWIDAEQGRAGGLTALVARGPKPVSAVPAATALPSFPALRPPRKREARVAPELIAELGRAAGCDLEGEAWPLDTKAALVLIPCGEDASGPVSAAFVVTGGKGAPARFDILPNWASGDGAPRLSGGEWNAGAGQLSHAFIVRGRLGDCGTAQGWVWDGNRFRLVMATRLETCRGAAQWPIVFRATPLYR